MGRKKEVVYTNGRLSGKYLSKTDCDRLECLLKLDKDKGCVQDLKHTIYCLSPSDVEQIKESKSSDFIEDMPKGELENLQTIGVAYMYFAKRLVLGDSVGIGKTVEVCGLCNLLEAELMKQGSSFRFLFLTQKALVSQARDEMIKFTGNYVEAVYGEKANVTKFCNQNKDDLSCSVVGAHSLIKSVEFQEFMRYYDEMYGYNPFNVLIIDEAGDILSNSATQMYKNAEILRDYFDRIILLNATPFEKELRMFYNQLNFIDTTLLPTKTDFSKEYEVMSYGFTRYPTFSGKYKNQDKFRDLVGYRYLARTRKKSGAIMKDCSAEIIEVPLSKEQRYLMSKTSMPNMVIDCPSYFNMGIESNTDTTPKLNALISLLTDRLRNVNSILIYSRYKESQKIIQETLSEYCITSEIMNGDTDNKTREDIITRFKLGDYRVLITNVQKGLNFGHCNHCIFYTYDPNPNKMVQFEGRMTRSFDIIDKHVYLLISSGNELKTFKNIVTDRAQASDVFAGSDFSCVMSLLLQDSKFNNEDDEELNL